MGNQTLVPSQIQSVETYFYDLKNVIHYKTSLGSTTFMKTARVTLTESADDVAVSQSVNRQLMQQLDINNVDISNTSNTSLSISPSLITPLSDTTNTSIVSSSTQSQPSQESSSSIPQQQQQQQQTSSSNPSSNAQRQQMRQQLSMLRELQQQAVVKVFPKYDSSLRLDVYAKRVREIRQLLYTRYGLCTNCLPYADLLLTSRAAYLFRQYVKYNLYDRLSTRPFLTMLEKRWLAFQLVCAVSEAHALHIVHGDIKTENVLVNSFLWLSLTDFASYKPVYLSHNHPSADFNYYFDISRRRTCYLAPERIAALVKEQQQENNDPTQETLKMQQPPDPSDFRPEMDIFSLGCVIAELFMERPLFTFAQLLAYRDRKYDPTVELRNEITDSDVRNMIHSMISVNAKDRKSASQYLQEQSDRAFPAYFVYLKSYVSRFIGTRLQPDDAISKLKYDLPILLKNFKLNLNTGGGQKQGSSNTEEMDEDQEQDLQQQQKLNEDDPKNDDNQNSSSSTSTTNDAFLILLSLLLSFVRKLRLTENKLLAVDLMQSFTKFLRNNTSSTGGTTTNSGHHQDSIILDRIIPYYLSLLEQAQLQPPQTTNPQQSETPPIVKTHVIHALTDCLAQISHIDIQNWNIFPEIIFDSMERLCLNDSYLVRSSVAKCLSSLALSSLRFLDSAFVNTNNKRNYDQMDSGSTTTTTELLLIDNNNQFAATTYDKEYERYQHRVAEIVMLLLSDSSSPIQTHPLSSSSSSSTSAAQAPSGSNNAVKETLIRSDLSKLCSFFSRHRTADFLLPHMITMLNEKTDWQVRAAFFDALCPVLACIGCEAVELVRPLMEQGMCDAEEFVIESTLRTLCRICELGLLDRAQISYFLREHVTILLCHPSVWIRQGAVHFVCIVCKQAQGNEMMASGQLNAADILCFVQPLLAKYLDLSLGNHGFFEDEALLMACLKKPLSRSVYDCIAQSARSDQLFVYLQQRAEIRRLTNQNYLPGYVDCADQGCQQFFEQLCQLGFGEEDEDKLLQMRQFIEKTRISRLSSSLHNNNTDLFQRDALNSGATNGCIQVSQMQTICHSELLDIREYPNSASSNVEFRRPPKTLSTDNLLTTTSNSIPEGSSSFNMEWKLMFGRQQQIHHHHQDSQSQQQQKQKQMISKSKSTQPHLLHLHQQQQQPEVVEPLIDCTLELERFLDRQKYFYDEQKLKWLRTHRLYRESINQSSQASRLFCLHSSAATGSKSKGLFWRPQGYLIVNSVEHTKEITKLCRNQDSSYFASMSYSESTVKLWSCTDQLLDGKSGFFKAVFTYDRQTNQNGGGGSNRKQQIGDQVQQMQHPVSLAFYDKLSLAILAEDFKFYIIDFNAARSQYRLSTHERLFRPLANSCQMCCCGTQNKYSSINNRTVVDRIQFYNLNSGMHRTRLNNQRRCQCLTNTPIEMIYVDDATPLYVYDQQPLVAAQGTSTSYRSSVARGLFVHSTSTGHLSAIELRSRSKCFDLRRDLRRGYITTMCSDPCYTWLCAGTSTGHLEVYDYRFLTQQPVRLFEHRSRTACVRLCQHPAQPNKLCASYQANNELAIWNMDQQSQPKPAVPSIMQQQQPEMVFWGVQSVPAMSQNRMSSFYLSGMVGCMSSSGRDDTSGVGLICSSTDMKIRYIDLNEPKDSYIVSSAFNNFQPNSSSTQKQQQQSSGTAEQQGSGANVIPQKSNQYSEFANSLVSHNVQYELRQIEGTKVLLELDNENNGGQNTTISNNSNNNQNKNSPALLHQTYFTHHQDAINDLIVCYNPMINRNQPLIVTGARDGTLKIWR